MSVPNSSAIENSLSARSEVEALLLEHPDVVDASLIHEEGPDGRSYPVAYVVPHAERMKEAKTQIYLRDRDKRIAQWRKTFDQVYRSGPGNHAPTFVGWTSSYTNKPVPDIEMKEWLDCTIERIMSLKPEKVLEIGCGVGLLVQELAPRCKVYRGTDLSPIAIGRLREFVASKPELGHVELLECEATSLDELASGSMDTVVINSVIQYFPDIEYLRTVIAAAARVVSPGGHIFIGDVRDLGLLPLFQAAIQLSKAPPKASARWMKRRIALAVEQERELVIDPQFFLDLPAVDSRITGAEIQLRRGKFHNELTRYRYDVVLHVGGSRPIPPQQELEWQAGGMTVAKLQSELQARQPGGVIIKNVPNRRLSSDIASLRRLWSADDRQSVEQIRQSVSSETDIGVDPEEFWELANEQYDVRIDSSPHSVDGEFDVTIFARDRSSGGPSTQPIKDVVSTLPRQRLATDPLEATFMQNLGLELMQGLNGRLPASKLPAAVRAVNELPPCEASTA